VLYVNLVDEDNIGAVKIVADDLVVGIAVV